MAVRTYLQAITDGLREAMAEDESVFVMGEDVGLGPTEGPDATLSGPPNLILDLLLGPLERPAAEAAGVIVEGDPAILDGVGRGSPEPSLI